jgi:uncharacterized OB-fold protein
MSTHEEPLLSAPHVIEYDYRRSLGPVLGRFFTSLRDRRIEGVVTAAGKVLVPPAEYDPATGDATRDEWVEVGPGGIVKSWAWVNEPRPQHPLDRPFAFALVKLDGADTELLHVLDAGDEGSVSTGMRVVPKWRSETIGAIGDIESFVPEEGA